MRVFAILYGVMVVTAACASQPQPLAWGDPGKPEYPPEPPPEPWTYTPVEGTTAPQVDASRMRIMQFSPWSQCSRRAPEPADAFWTPVQTDVEEIEARLPLAIKPRTLEHPLAEYCRRYAGTERKQRRFIYIDAFHCPVVHEDDWDQFACDGGSSFWGIEYDVEAKAFSPVELNGGLP